MQLGERDLGERWSGVLAPWEGCDGRQPEGEPKMDYTLRPGVGRNCLVPIFCLVFEIC